MNPVYNYRAHIKAGADEYIIDALADNEAQLRKLIKKQFAQKNVNTYVIKKILGFPTHTSGKTNRIMDIYKNGIKL